MAYGQVPATSENFGDVIAPGFKVIFEDIWKEIKDNISLWYDIQTSTKAYAKYSSVGPYTGWEAFTGTVKYHGVEQGYKTTINFPEYTAGFQIERRLYDDKEYPVMNLSPEGMAKDLRSYRRIYAASELNEAFTTEPSDGDGCELYGDAAFTFGV